MVKPQSEVSALEVALDVLQSFSIRLRPPNCEMLSKLRNLAEGTSEQCLADDELARFIVHRELSRRAGSPTARRADRAA
jgi:hypothetical protein